MIRVESKDVAPSQDFLKEKTVRFILECVRNGEEDQLPPAPIVRKDGKGEMVAIDGHNLLAVNTFLGRETEVHIAKDKDDGLPATSEANTIRNQDLRDKFESCLVERDTVKAKGVSSFNDLIEKYPQLLEEVHHG